MAKSKQISITLDAEDYEALAELAEREERSVNRQVRCIIRRFFVKGVYTPERRHDHAA